MKDNITWKNQNPYGKYRIKKMHPKPPKPNIMWFYAIISCGFAGSGYAVEW